MRLHENKTLFRQVTQNTSAYLICIFANKTQIKNKVLLINHLLFNSNSEIGFNLVKMFS